MPEPMAVLTPLLLAAMMLLPGVYTDPKVPRWPRLVAFLAFLMVTTSVITGLILQEMS